MDDGATDTEHSIAPDADRVREIIQRLSEEARPLTNEVEHLRHEARVHEARGDIDAALDLYDQAYELSRTEAELADAIALERARVAGASPGGRAAEAWNVVAEARRRTGDNEGLAQALFHRYWCGDDEGVAVLHEATALGTDIGWARRAAAQISIHECQFEQALELDHGAIEIARGRSDHELECASLVGASVSCAELGALEDAIGQLSRAIAIATSLRDHRTVVTGRLNRCLMLCLQMRMQEAVDETAGLASYVDLHHLDAWRADVYAQRAMMLWGMGRIDEAQQALALLQQLDAPPGAGSAYQSVLRAEIMIEAGIEGDVEGLLDEAERAATAFGATALEWDARFLRARLRAADGDLDGALELVDQLPDVADDQSASVLALWMARQGPAFGDVLFDRATGLLPKSSPNMPRLWRVAAREVRATLRAFRDSEYEDLERVIAEWRAAGRAPDVVRARMSLAAAYAHNGDQPVAARTYNQARREMLETGALGDLDLLSSRLAQLGGDVDVRHVSESSILEGLSERERLEVERIATTARYEAGAVLFSREEPNGALWFVRSGRVRLSLVDGDRHLTLELQDPGDVFGEEAVLEDATAVLQAEADEDVVVGVIDAAVVRDLVRRIPRLGLNLLELTGRRLDRARRTIEHLAFWTVDRRILHVILELDQRYGHPTLDGGRLINRTFTHAQLAEMVNARRETVGEFLKGLRAEGLIDLRKRRIVIPDVAALRSRLG